MNPLGKEISAVVGFISIYCKRKEAFEAIQQMLVRRLEYVAGKAVQQLPTAITGATKEPILFHAVY